MRWTAAVLWAIFVLMVFYWVALLIAVALIKPILMMISLVILSM